MNSTILSAESEPSGLLPNPFIGESSPMTPSVPFSKLQILHNYAQDKVCLFPCFSAGELYIRVRISMTLMRGRESKGLTTDISIDLLITSMKPFLKWVSRLTKWRKL